MSDQTAEPATDPNGVQIVIDWEYVLPGSPDITPPGCDGPCVPGKHCEAMLADQKTYDALVAGCSPMLLAMLGLGPVAFCSRDAHGDNENDGPHVAGNGEQIVCVWWEPMGDEPMRVRWAPYLGLDDVGPPTVYEREVEMGRARAESDVER